MVGYPISYRAFIHLRFLNHEKYHTDQLPPRMQRKSTSEEPTESWWGWPWNPNKTEGSDELVSLLLFIDMKCGLDLYTLIKTCMS